MFDLEQAFEFGANHIVQDPCFIFRQLSRKQIDPYTHPVCLVAPFDHVGLIVAVSEPLAWIGARTVMDWKRPWALELPDGVRCARKYEEDRLKYDCFTTPAGKRFAEIEERFVGWVVGYPFRTPGVGPLQVEFKRWDREKTTAENNLVETHSVPVVTAWN